MYLEKFKRTDYSSLDKRLAKSNQKGIGTCPNSDSEQNLRNLPTFQDLVRPIQKSRTTSVLLMKLVCPERNLGRASGYSPTGFRIWPGPGLGPGLLIWPGPVPGPGPGLAEILRLL